MWFSCSKAKFNTNRYNAKRPNRNHHYFYGLKKDQHYFKLCSWIDGLLLNGWGPEDAHELHFSYRQTFHHAVSDVCLVIVHNKNVYLLLL